MNRRLGWPSGGRSCRSSSPRPSSGWASARCSRSCRSTSPSTAWTCPPWASWSPPGRRPGWSASGCWLADRVPRRPITGLVLASVFAVLPLFIVGPRRHPLPGVFGDGGGDDDPAARAYLVDANPPERQGEAFGLYSGADRRLHAGARDRWRAGGGHGSAHGRVLGGRYRTPGVRDPGGRILVPEREHLHARRTPRRPRRLRSRRGRTRWSTRPADPTGAPAQRPARGRDHVQRRELLRGWQLRGHLEPVHDLAGGRPGGHRAHVLLLRPSAAAPVALHGPLHRPRGRLLGAGRRGGRHRHLRTPVPLVPESGGWCSWASSRERRSRCWCRQVFLLAARAAPPGRTSSAQGLLGGAGTVGTIVASLAAGSLAAIDLRYPFWVTGAVTLITLALGLAIGSGGSMTPCSPGPVPGSGGSLRVGGEAHDGAVGARGPRGLPPAPVVLVLGGFLTSPPLYRPLPRAAPAWRGRRGRRATSGRWTGCCGLARARGGPRPVGRGFPEASRRSGELAEGAPVLVIGHSAGGMSARLLTSPVPYAGPAAERLLADRGHRDARDPARRLSLHDGARNRVRRRGGRVRQPRGPGTVLRAGDGVPGRGITQGLRAARRLDGGAADLGRLPGPDAGTRDRRDQRRRADSARVRAAPGRPAPDPGRRGPRPGHRPRLVRLGSVRGSLGGRSPSRRGTGRSWRALPHRSSRFDGSGDRRYAGQSRGGAAGSWSGS